ncbi:unnamed protein product [marine sediment metagenome]|uniref:Uncharacterized protein n=1 Tax=marine sediment metagenome TaxID=412755 RepID=X0XU26_9ZZZZ
MKSLNLKRWPLAIIFSVLVVVVLYVYIIAPMFRENTYVEMTNSLYKLSWECIADNYSDDLTEDGIVFRTDSYVNGTCSDVVFLRDVKRRITGLENRDETLGHAKFIVKQIKESDANAVFIKSIILMTEDGEVVEDWTDKFNFEDEEVEDAPLDQSKTKFAV